MPSVPKDPDKHLLNKISSLESRIQLLETQRRNNRLWVLASGGNGDTFNSGSYTEVVWDNVYANSTDDGIWDGSTGITLPYTGVYMFIVTMPLVNTGTINFDVGLRLTEEGGSPVQMRTTSLTVYTSALRQVWIPFGGDMLKNDQIAIGITSVGGTRTLTSSLDFQIFQVG